MKLFSRIIPIAVILILASIYLYPIFSGLILLPLDLLVSNSNPWNMAGTILLKNPYMQDSIIQMFPWKHLTFQSLTNGILPLWNPYQFLGMPFMAGMKPLVFYPLNILFIFGEVIAWNGLLWFQIVLSLYFTYILLRSLKLEFSYALFGSIAFAFNTVMITTLEFGSEGHVLLWLPFLLFCIREYVGTGKIRYLTGISVGIAFSLLAGHLQYFAYMAILCAAFGYFEFSRDTTLNRLRVAAILLYACLGAGIAAVQILPGIELFRYSYRGIADTYPIFANGLLTPVNLLRLLSPDWFGNPVSGDLIGGYIESTGYIGIIPLFFSVYALFYRKTYPYVSFFAAVLAGATLLSVSGIGQILYYLRIPVITSGYGGRMFILSLFSLSMLSAFGLSIFIQTKDLIFRKKYSFIGIGTIVILYVLGVTLHAYGFTEWVKVANIKFQIISVAILVFSVSGYIRLSVKYPWILRVFLLILISVTYADVFREGYRFLTFSNTKFLYPDMEVTKYVRSSSKYNLGRVYGLTEPEVHSVLNVYSPETYNPLYPKRTATLLQALENKSDVPLPVNKYYLTKNERMKYVLDFLGVMYIVPGKGKNPATEYWNNTRYESELTKVYEDAGNDVYLNKAAYPRFGLFYSVRDQVDDKTALEIIANRGVDFRKTLLLSGKVAYDVREGSGSARLLRSDINSLSFSIVSDVPAMFYLSDTYFPGWHAVVNNSPAAIYTANYNFRAVPVPAGESVLEMWYMPSSVEYGAYISIASIIVLAVCSFILYKKMKPAITQRTRGRRGTT